MPLWLVAYLLQNKTPTTPPVSKLSFVLLPWVSKDPEMEILPELLNTYVSASLHHHPLLDGVNNKNSGLNPN